MKIFLVTDIETNNIPFISLKSAYKEFKGNVMLFPQEEYPSFEEFQKIHDKRKAKGKHFYYRKSWCDDKYNVYIEELEIKP